MHGTSNNQTNMTDLLCKVFSYVCVTEVGAEHVEKRAAVHWGPALELLWP